MAQDDWKSSKRVLDPIERSSEVLFGLVMVLTFTGSLSAAQAGHAQVRTMLIGALGCNLAWGIIDALMYLMSALSQRGHSLQTFRAVRAARDPGQAHRMIADALPPLLASLLPAEQVEVLRQKLLQMPEAPSRPRLRKDDWHGAMGVFLMVFLSTFPVVVPFLFVADVYRAMRISNGIAIVMLALTGYSYGRYSGQRPWVWAISLILLGAAMVGLTIRLGG